MGKALVFKGITITNPLETVTFSDGLAAPVRAYLGKLTTTVSDAKAQAFQSFYETLNSAGIWDKITLLYPMFGSAGDCAFGLKGDDLTIPTGATYSKGIDLTNASGGYGNAGKGIKLIDTFPTTTTTNYSLFVNYPNGWTIADRGYAFVYASSSTRTAGTSSGRWFGHSYADNNWCNIHSSVAELVAQVTEGTKGLFGETHNFSSMVHNLYIKGEVVQTVTGNYSSTTDVGGFGINASAQSNQTNHLLNVPVNMIIVCNGNFLTTEEVTTLTDAVGVLTNVIFT